MSKLSTLDYKIDSAKGQNYKQLAQEVYGVKTKIVYQKARREELGSFERSNELSRNWNSNPFG